MPPAFLAGSGVPLGDVPSAVGESSRTDFVMISSFSFVQGTGTLKFGATIRASSHAMAHSSAELGNFLYSDVAALLAGQGFGRVTSAPEVSFGTQEYGIFAQYESALTQGLRVSFGGRYDCERISGDGVTLNTDWLTASGLRNDDFPGSLHQFGACGSITWNPSANADTRMFLLPRSITGISTLALCTNCSPSISVRRRHAFQAIGSTRWERSLSSNFLALNNSVFRPDTIIRIRQTIGLLSPFDDGSGVVRWRLLPRGGADVVLEVKVADISVSVSLDTAQARVTIEITVMASIGAR